MPINNNERERWEEEKPVYEEIGVDVSKKIISVLKNRGVSAKVTYRTKETDSLIKKISRKETEYEAIHDKVGVRIISSFKEQLKVIDELICKEFCSEIKKRENMSEALGNNVFGYQAIHYDLCKTIDNVEYFCEIQLRTTCQDNWSELSHALAYKTEIDIPVDIMREINALSAVFELADNQFQLIQTLIEKLPETSPVRILNFLEKFFYSKIGDSYDKELSGNLLNGIDALYDENPIEVLQNFIDDNEGEILKVIETYKDNFFFTQPEIVLILERLQNRKYAFKGHWENVYSLGELEVIANAWGTSLE